MSFVLTTAERITGQLDAMIAEMCPAAGRRAMYGGIVFMLNPGKHDSMVCGHFIYKKHVSLEFPKGYLLTDPDKVLVGSGKYRRHIKLYDLDDIESRSVRAMLKQAFALAREGC